MQTVFKKKHMITLATELAKKVEFNVRHGCVIFKGNRVISTGYNQIRYCNKLDKKYRKWINSLHAEQKAIIFSNDDLRRCSILVVRLNNNNELKNSRPCSKCLGLIKDVGIRNIYYSNNDGQIEKL